MTVKEELLKKLRAAFDLNIYEVKIWTALLSRGIATAGELSDMSNVPRSRSYDVLESLEKKSFVIMKLGKPIRYIAVKPEEILRRLKDQVEQKAEEHVKFLDQVKDEEVFQELELLYKQGVKKIDSYSLAGSVRGRDAIYSHLRSMMERAEKQVVIATSADGLQRKVKRFKSLFSKLAENGVKIKILSPAVEHSRELNDVKGKVQLKFAEGIKGRYVIIDDKEMVFMVTDDKEVQESFDTAVWVNTPYFVKAFNEMFNNTWNNVKGSNGEAK